MVCATPGAAQRLRTAQVQEMLRRGDWIPSKQCIHRWVRTGVGGIKLKCERIGATRWYKPEDVAEFIRACTEAGCETR